MGNPWGIKYEPFSRKPWQDSWSPETKQIWVDEAIKGVLGKVDSIEAHIHRLSLSGRVYRDVDLLLGLGAIEDDGEINIQEKPSFLVRRRSNYRKGYRIYVDEYDLDVFTKPKDPNAAKARIELSYPTPSFLRKLHGILPGLKVSSAEYAIDFHFKSPWQAKDFYLILKRYFFTPRLRQNWKRKGVTHRSLRVIEPTETGGHEYIVGRNLKIYTRGAEERKVGRTWKQIDKRIVRIERTIRRDDLKKRAIGTPSEFADMCSMEYFWLDQIEFRKFKGTGSDVPEEWEKYRTLLRDKKCSGCFMASYFRAGDRAYRKTAKAQGFTGLLMAIKRQLHGYDQAWARGEIVRPGCQLTR